MPRTLEDNVRIAVESELSECGATEEEAESLWPDVLSAMVDNNDTTMNQAATFVLRQHRRRLSA